MSLRRILSGLQSMEGSLPPPLLQNRACHFCGTRLLSDVPFVRGIRLAVADSPEDLGSDVSRLPLAGHRSLALTRGFSRFFALLLLITCPSPSSRQRLLGIPPGRGFLRNPSPYAMRLAPAPVIHTARRGQTGLLRSQVPWFASVGRCSPPGLSAVHTGQYRRLPAPYPVPFGSSASASCAGSRSRWLNAPSLALPVDACETGYPA